MSKNKLISGYLDLLKDFGEFSDDYPYLLDLETNQLWLSKPMEDKLDLMKEDPSIPYYTMKEWLSIVHSQDRSMVYNNLNTLSPASKERVPHNIFFRAKSKWDDSYLTIHSQGTFKNVREQYPLIIGKFSILDYCTLPTKKPLISERIRAIQDLFFYMDEFVYMTDMDTNELIYLNQVGLNQYGFNSLSELYNKKCYDVLQNSSTVCSFCTNEHLEPLKYTEWKVFNPVIKKHFILKDTMILDGEKRYRLEIALDVTENEETNTAAKNFRSLEKIANEGIRHALSEASPDDSIQSLLEYLGKAINGDRVYIFEKNEQGNDDNTYEWVASGIEPQIDNLQNLPAEICDIWYSAFAKGKPIVIANLEDIRYEDHELYDVLAPQDIHSIVVVPIYLDGGIMGFYGVDNPPTDSLDYTYNLLNLVSYFLTSAMKRRRLLRQMHDLGYQDPFTKFGNRLAMKEYIVSIDPAKSIGILYCDITGLKFTNDHFGHEAGDQLILNACVCLKEVFPKDKLFRIGGDELLVICPETNEEILKEKTVLLQEKLKEKSVILAIGMEYRDNLYDSKIEDVIKIAEKYMYEDKSLYYKTKGLDRRLH